MAKESRKKRTARKQKEHRSELHVTPLAEHARIGNEVIPPFAKIQRDMGSKFVSADWTEARLPEMIWAAITIAIDRDSGLQKFRDLGMFIKDSTKADGTRDRILSNVTITGLAAWTDLEFDAFESIVVADSRSAFSVLGLFEKIPARERWLRIAPLDNQQSLDDQQPLDVLKRAVGTTLWHQTQEATDCRWMKCLAAFLARRISLPNQEMIKELLNYPNYGDQKKVRPSVRAHEMAIDEMDSLEVHEWATAFWLEVFELTRNDHTRFSAALPTNVSKLSRETVLEIRSALVSHFEIITRSTSVDPRLEATFGFAAYSLDLMLEMLSLGNSTSRMSRMALRSIAEAVINLTRLARRDDLELWTKFRNYGYGQAKLAYLKMLETEELPSFVTLQSLEALSNENVWHEFQAIHVGNWADPDLRTISQAHGIKDDVYDRYYDWSSAFVHCNWAAMRDAEYDLCLNPLHKLHRLLTKGPKALPDIISDAVVLTNRILDLLNGLYPQFPNRLPTNVANIS